MTNQRLSIVQNGSFVCYFINYLLSSKVLHRTIERYFAMKNLLQIELRLDCDSEREVAAGLVDNTSVMFVVLIEARSCLPVLINNKQVAKYCRTVIGLHCLCRNSSDRSENIQLFITLTLCS